MAEAPGLPGGAAVALRGGRVVDEHGERRADLLVVDGAIAAVGERLELPGGTVEVDCGGAVVAPGLVDLHTHLREPGGERAETVESGSRAAALGGYAAVVAMPNTEPTIDCAAIVRDVRGLAKEALCHVAVAGAITEGRRGERLAAIGEMAALGVVLFTDDGSGVQDNGLMRRALEYASDLGVVLAEHCEDSSLAAGGHMHEGAVSARLGIPGQPALAEEQMLARDLALVRVTGAPMHFLHLSTAGSVALVAAAKSEGLPVTAEATPHHLTLTDELVSSYDARFKVNPPLRTAPDTEAVRAGLRSGVIDAIATDHAPHPAERKEEPFDLAPPGMTGLETALAVAHSVLVAEAGEEALTLADLFALLSWQPAEIARLRDAGFGGPLTPGSPAHVVVFDPAQRWTVVPEQSASRSRNTPFGGRELTGRVRHQLLGGEVVVLAGAATR
ncbi:MAG TPA: dihydroorotase [Acidimicrobiales bacterium]|nr:dihydroorotase [Acidimicrobiales bacterium]